MALFGEKGTVTNYATFEALTILSFYRNHDLLQGRIQRAYQKALERG